MSKLFESITPQLEKWISHQQMFFVATAPLSENGHINCSPKGLDSFRILSPTLVAYQDLTGSGIETIAHIQENERILIMFCAFDGAPKIVRLHGHGKAVLPTDPAFADMESKFPKRIGVRAYIQIELTRITDSCGYSVPLYLCFCELQELVCTSQSQIAAVLTHGLSVFSQPLIRAVSSTGVAASDTGADPSAAIDTTELCMVRAVS